MRYTLRNKKKIESALGVDILKRIVVSLDEHFATCKISLESVEDEPYDILIISDIGHTCQIIALYVTSKKFDVYNLAFKEFIG